MKRKANARYLGAPNRNHLLFGQPRTGVLFAAKDYAGQAAAPFGEHIGHVVSVGAEKQMIRVTARRIVTAMADEQARGNLSMNATTDASWPILIVVRAAPIDPYAGSLVRTDSLEVSASESASVTSLHPPSYLRPMKAA